MADAWDQFADAPQDDPWAQFQDAQEAPQTQAPQSVATETPGRFGTMQDGVAEAALSLGSSAIAAPVAGLAGAVSAPFVGADRASQVIDRFQRALTYQPRTQTGQKAVELISYPFEKLAQGADFVGGKVADATGSPAAGAVVNTAIQSAPGLVGLRGRVGNGRSSPSRPSSPVATGAAEAPDAPAAPAGRQPGLGRVSAKPPSIDELRAQQQAAYKRAEDAGIKVSEGSVTGLKTRIVADLKKDGLNQKLHPDAAAALDEILGTKGDLTLTEVETLRKIAGDARQSMKPADARLAGKIVDHIDDYLENLADGDVLAGDATAIASLKEARSLTSRVKKTEEIEGLIERAKISAQGFSGSGFENALRTEFRALAKNQKKMRRFSPQERAAIVRVAKGGPMDNAMRYIGKLAPTGSLSTFLNLGATAVGGPAALAIPAIGTAGRVAATRMTLGNANRAAELMRAGPNALSRPRRNALAEEVAKR